VTLTAADIRLHAALGIDEAMLEAARVTRVDDAGARSLGIRHAGDLAGLVYAYVHPCTGYVRTYRLRRDHPEMENGKPKDKYLSPAGDRKDLYFPPGVSTADLADLRITVVFVESEKAALALMAAAARLGLRVIAIATGGCWGWCGRIGKVIDAAGARVDEKGPLPDLALFTWGRRDGVILFDANAATNDQVRAARRAFAHDLIGRGANVRIGALPAEAGLNGPDDYIGKHGDSALFTLIDAAAPAQRSQDLPIAELIREHRLTADEVTGLAIDLLEERLRALALALTGADPLRRALVVKELKRSKVPATVVDAALTLRADAAKQESPGTITLPDDEPWAEPVEGSSLLSELATLILRHVVMTATEAYAVALWIVAAHAIDALQLMPMLLISSPAPECGKTTAATLIAALVPRAIMVASLTPAVLFRMIDKYRPTLIADEVDSWLNDEKSELRGVFNAGHMRAGALFPRCVGDDHDVRLFNVFGAKLIAMIGRPPETMLSRSILVTLRRKTAAEPVEHVREESVRAEHAVLRRRLRRWALDHAAELSTHQPDLPAGIPVNRASDNWRPLLSVADRAGGDSPARAGAAALAASGARPADETQKVALLADVRVVFREKGDPASLSSDEITEGLKGLSERPWGDWNKGRGLSVAQLAKRLRDFGTGPFGLHTRDTRIGSKVAKRWHREDFTEPFSRFLPDDPQHPQQSNESGPKSSNPEPQQTANVAAPKTSSEPMNPDPVAGVAGSSLDLEREALDGLF
jgi:Protein of unknown function (DUF3631)/Domain of unknown function (DUF3854)